VRIPGYHDELFWPAFLFHVGMAGSAAAAFGADPADLDEYLRFFEDPGHWPVFAVPVGGGTMHLVCCNLPGDVGIDCVLDSNVSAAVRRVAEDEGGYPTGGIPWPLLPAEPGHLLMALPMTGDNVVPHEVVARVEEALAAVGARSGVDALAVDLLRHRACMLTT
jgi:hypothetical protein